MLSENQQRSGVCVHYASRLFPKKKLTKSLVCSRFSCCSKRCLVFSNYMFNVFLSTLLITAVNILYPVHSNDIPV